MTEASTNEERHAPEIAPAVVELRQYTLKPGRRDELIELFERHFIEGQEEAGIQLPGQFRCRTDENLFVWLRGFPDMEARRQALQRFYYGPVWLAHRAEANDTMLDSDNVLLLKPACPASGLLSMPSEPSTGRTQDRAGGLIVATIYHFKAPVMSAFVAFFAEEMAPVLCTAGATLVGSYLTETAENTFPQLPVRTGENVFVWLASFADEEAYSAYQKSCRINPQWSTVLVPALMGWLAKPPEVLELMPTRCSRLRHRAC